MPPDDTTPEGRFARLVERIAALPHRRPRSLVAIAGPPGSGKSTLAERLVAELRARGQGAALAPMDGFHLDNALLRTAGLMARKGAPETFDAAGLLNAVRRLATEAEVVLPAFDRARDIAVAGRVQVAAEDRIVVVEGNYLCLDETPWSQLRPLWDYAVFLDVPIAELERRLVRRWLDHGLDADAALRRARSNDVRNAELVSRRRMAVDCTLAL